MKTSQQPVTEMPKLHLFSVIPHPERGEMVPRTYDALTLLGAGSSMAEQGDLADRVISILSMEKVPEDMVRYLTAPAWMISNER